MSKVSIRTLGDLCEVINGSTPNTKDSDFWGGPHQWVTPKEMGSLKSPFISQTARTLSDSGLSSISAKLLPKFSIILSSRAPIGYLAVNKEPMATNQGCKGLIPSAELDYMFLYYFLLANRERLNSLGTGTTFAELSSTALKRFEIPLPPLDEQKRIVAKLDQVSSEVESLENSLDEQLEALKSLFGLAAAERLLGRKRTVDPGVAQVRGAAKWALVKLGEICDLYQPETIPRKRLKEDGQYVVYGANGPIGKYDRFNHEQSEVTMTCRGATCGTINVTPPETWITGNAMVIRPKSEAISKEFLATVLPHLDLSQTISGTAQPQITRKSLSPLLVPVPTMAEQKRIIAELDELEVKIRDLENNLVTQRSLVSAFQSAALSTALAGGV